MLTDHGFLDFYQRKFLNWCVMALMQHLQNLFTYNLTEVYNFRFEEHHLRVIEIKSSPTVWFIAVDLWQCLYKHYIKCDTIMLNAIQWLMFNLQVRRTVFLFPFHNHYFNPVLTWLDIFPHVLHSNLSSQIQSHNSDIDNQISLDETPVCAFAMWFFV